jgi:hypothetical protein
MANLKINLRISEKWDSLPDSWKSVKKVKKAEIKYNLTDKNLISLFEPFFNDDGLRISMSGLNVNSSSLVATDAHKLIQLRNVGGIDDGTYIISPKIAKKVKKPIGKLNDKFPDWKVIIHQTTDKVFSVDVIKLKTYCEAVIKGKYVNSVTNKVTFMIGYENKTIQTISFDAQNIIETLNVFLKLGNKYIYAGYNTPNQAMYFTPDSYIAKNPINGIGGGDFILIMPMMGYYEDPNFVGAKDVDFNTEIRVYYSFEDDQIHNADGSIAKFDYELNSNYLPYMNDYEFDLLKRVAGNSAKMPILDCVCVKNNEAFASDWTQSISIYSIFIEDGIYEIVSGALKDTEYQVSDFPMQMQKFMYFLEGTLDTMKLYQCVQEAKNYVIDDDKRPSLQGIGYVTDNDGKLTINGTNAHILFSKKLDNENPIKINNVLKNPEMQEFVFRGMDKFVNVYSTENGNFYKFISSTISYITESSAVPPKYKDVIPNYTNCVLALNKDIILEEVQKLKGDEAKNNIIFKFDQIIKNKDEANGLVTIFTTKFANPTNKKYEVDREILSIQYDIFKFEREWDDNVALMMQQANFENDELEFKANDLEIFLSTEQKGIGLYYNSNKSSGIFVVPLLDGFAKYPSSPQQKSPALPPTPVSAPSTLITRESIQSIIKGYEIKAKRGDKSAEAIIKGYQIKLKRL